MHRICFPEYVRWVRDELYRHGLGEGTGMSKEYIKANTGHVQPWTEEFWKATQRHRLLDSEMQGLSVFDFLPAQGLSGMLVQGI